MAVVDHHETTADQKAGSDVTKMGLDFPAIPSGGEAQDSIFDGRNIL